MHLLALFWACAGLSHSQTISPAASAPGSLQGAGSAAANVSCPKDLELVQVQRVTKIGPERFAISYSGARGKGSQEMSKSAMLADGIETGRSLCLPLSPQR